MEVETLGVLVALIVAYNATKTVRGQGSLVKIAVFFGTLLISFMVALAMMKSAAWIAGNVVGTGRLIAPAPDVQFGVIFWIFAGALVVAFTTVRAAEFLTGRKFSATPIVVIVVLLSASIRGIWLTALPDYMARENQVAVHAGGNGPTLTPVDYDPFAETPAASRKSNPFDKFDTQPATAVATPPKGFVPHDGPYTPVAAAQPAPVAQTWEAASVAWAAAHPLFASDPHKMATMQQAIDEIDDGKMTPDELLKAAHFRAVSTLHKQGVHVIAELGSAPQAIVDPFAEAPAHSDGPWTKYQAQPSAKPAYTPKPGDIFISDEDARVKWKIAADGKMVQFCEPGFKLVVNACYRECERHHYAPEPWVDECKLNKNFVDRNFFGGCPAGYVDHPMEPEQCALPAIAERMLSAARGR